MSFLFDLERTEPVTIILKFRFSKRVIDVEKFEKVEEKKCAKLRNRQHMLEGAVQRDESQRAVKINFLSTNA